MGSPTEAEALGRRLLDAAELEVDGPNPWDPQINDGRIWERVLRDRELGLGEAYQEGWFDVEALDEMLSRIITVDLFGQIKPGLRLLAVGAQQVLLNNQTIRRARRNASAHYDIGNDLYERMLDKRMIYSSAYWRNATDLDTAQEAKLDLICRKLSLEPGMRVLDIGCGWGGFSHFAASRYGAHVTGISPAAEQVKLARVRCDDLPVDIRQLDYRDVTGTYDRIVSIGMMEHVGPKNMATFFEVCKTLLDPDGMMLHHTIGRNYTSSRSDAWFDKYIFPGGVLPSVAQIARAAEPDWVIEDLHNFGPDYDRTLMCWSANVTAAWDELPMYDEQFRRMWHYYLMGTAAGFRTRVMQLWQVVFRRARRRTDVYQAVR
ncbi:MAG: cyclopropane fatty acyl phospholipid synthase [Acidimicrobiales bacterium]